MRAVPFGGLGPAVVVEPFFNLLNEDSTGLTYKVSCLYYILKYLTDPVGVPTVFVSNSYLADRRVPGNLPNMRSETRK